MPSSNWIAIVLSVFFVGIACASPVAHELDQSSLEEAANFNKRAAHDAYYMPRASNWISSRPMKSLNSAAASDEIGYLLQFLDKRSGEFSDDMEGDRAIRSPLGTMRFGKRAAAPLGTMRFGKRAAAPLGTMRFGRR